MEELALTKMLEILPNVIDKSTKNKTPLLDSLLELTNAVTTLTVPDGVGTDTVRIENDLFRVGHDVYPDIAKKLGYSINAWVREEDGSNDVIICCEERSNMEYEDINAEDFEEISGRVLSYYSGTRLRRITLPASCKFIYNGK